MSTVSGKCSANSVAASGTTSGTREQQSSLGHGNTVPSVHSLITWGGALVQAGSSTLLHTVRSWEDITGGVTQSISKSITHRHRVNTSNSYGTVTYKMMTN